MCKDPIRTFSPNSSTAYPVNTQPSVTCILTRCQTFRNEKASCTMKYRQPWDSRVRGDATLGHLAPSKLAISQFLYSPTSGPSGGMDLRRSYHLGKVHVQQLHQHATLLEGTVGIQRI
ncbi:hypothetical protein K431DRAFT_99256 [Polychaeton citri CBS 116435]|uniref:Uncharacterized protein n=1 Tax=Polychaeton citri CBS 116435 TaxID=1314669 RepID=A0A9P4UUK5_9PEZI|nr:hypothetical protein K431DRAFT_99256 [Polychaeton citri CBS 116435]